MDFTITIPCRNRIHVANEAIECFLNSCNYFILIIDDISDLPTTSYISHERVKVIYNKIKSGYARLANQCICESKTEYIIIASDKIRVKTEDIKRIENKLKEGFACVCTRLMHIYGFSKDLINKIGLFDTGFTKSGFEDTDWMNRLFMNNLALYSSFETGVCGLNSCWSQNYQNKEYYNTKWKEDFINNKLIQLHESQNSESKNLFQGKYSEKKYLPWSNSELKAENIKNYYNNKTGIKNFKVDM